MNNKTDSLPADAWFEQACPDCGLMFTTLGPPAENEVCSSCFDNFNGMTIEELEKSL
jgi:hypothetical protein